MITRTFFVQLNILPDDDIEKLALELESDLLSLGYDVIKVDLKNLDNSSISFSTETPIQPF